LKTKAATVVALVLTAALVALGAGPGARAWAADLSGAAAQEDLEDLESLDDLGDEAYLEAGQKAPDQAWDPLIGWNRGVYRFNDSLYYWVMKPVAEGYRYVVPLTARIWVKNFFLNLAMPIRFVNSLLQLKIRRAQAEFARFFFNSTYGILGFGNPASKYPELNPPPEDTGQTLGYWGIGAGPYIVWPLLGPSTLRDTFGLAGDYALYPVSYSRSLFFSVGVSTYTIVNQTSLAIGEYEAIQEAAIDPYIAIREAFVDNRRKMVAE
jgi:phospholipid-binding lipoprotein MlaA